MSNKVFIRLLKKHTLIDQDFIDIFFKKFKIGEELSFHIDYNDVANYLGVTARTIKRRLLNNFSKQKLFFEKVDYIKVKKDNKIIYFLNYKCFERLSMLSDSKKSEDVREYFSKLREFISEHSNIIYQAMENKEDLKKYNNLDTIYFFAADERYEEILKLGVSKKIIQRLNNYNVGRIHEVDLKYLAVIKNAFIIEKCVKKSLKKYAFHGMKELYKVSPEMMEKVINRCYRKHTTKDDNEEMYNDLASLIGFHSYIKNKKNIKPYIVIKKFT